MSEEPKSGGPVSEEFLADLAAASRILAARGVVDAFGHVSQTAPRRSAIAISCVGLEGAGARRDAGRHPRIRASTAEPGGTPRGAAAFWNALSMARFQGAARPQLGGA